MTLSELRNLAEATNRGEWSEQVSAVHEMMERLSPERILALLDCVVAADAYRDASTQEEEDDSCISYDAARKRSEEL